ncbi:EamA family transporter [Gordonia sinesedis]
MRTTVWAAAFVVCWSSGFVGAVLARPAGDVAGLLAWRYLVTAAVLVVLLAALRPRRVGGREVLRHCVLGVLAHVVFLGGVFGAAEYGVDAGTVALVCAIQPMLVTVLGRVWWGDRVRLRQVVGLAVGLAAVAITVGGGVGGAGIALLLPVASLCGLSAAALLERRWASPTDDVLTALTVQVIVAAGVFTLVALVRGEIAIGVTPTVLGAITWLVLLSGLGGYASFLMCLRRLGSTTTSLLLYLTPPVTTLWAWMMFSDTPSPAQWLGLVVGAAAVGLAWPWRRSARGLAAVAQRRRETIHGELNATTDQR